ncbi:MAG: CBS domain-containing protein, partial [Leptolyngbya sp. SIO4C5]|nr:CBS domain-containing protein [Leptolyngbya sp. SIO4C5]
RVGQFFGWTAIVIGVLSVLGVTQFGSVWTILIGFFLLQNANRSAQFAEVQEQLDGLTAADAITADSPIVQQSTTLRQFADDAVLTADKRWRKYLVVNESEQLIGTIAVSALQDVPREDWETVTVSDRLQPIESVEEVGSDKPLLDVLKLFEEKRVSELVVLGEDRSLLGLLEKSSIVRLLQKRSEVTPA